MYCDESRIEFGEGDTDGEIVDFGDHGGDLKFFYPRHKKPEGVSINADKFNEYLGDESNVDDLKINFADNTVTILFSQKSDRVKGALLISCDISKVEIVDGDKAAEIVAFNREQALAHLKEQV